MKSKCLLLTMTFAVIELRHKRYQVSPPSLKINGMIEASGNH